MKKIAILGIGFLFLIGCSSAPTVVEKKSASQQNSNVDLTVKRSDDDLTVSSHSQVKKEDEMSDANAVPVQKSDKKTKWTQSGNPIDTTGFDTEIKQIQDKLKANPKAEDLKKMLADAYVQRAIALTEARQYASALGDYRKAQKLDPENEEAKKWIGQIISIYEGINREYPKEGEEPPPLPFKN